MKKIKDFVKRIQEWYKESNRYRHAKAGTVILVVMLVLGTAMFIPLWKSAVNATVTCFIANASADFKDKQHGGLFDWNDVLSGTSPALLFDLLLIVYYLIRVVL